MDGCNVVSFDKIWAEIKHSAFASKRELIVKCVNPFVLWDFWASILIKEKEEWLRGSQSRCTIYSEISDISNPWSINALAFAIDCNN